MADDLTERDSGIDLRESGGGWRMYTRARFAPYVERLLLDGSRSKLTRAALETLAVVAYRQPVTRARVSAVRGSQRRRGHAHIAGTRADYRGRNGLGHRCGDVRYHRTVFGTTGAVIAGRLPDIAPLLPDVDMIDDLSETLDAEPRFVKLSGDPVSDDQAVVVRRGPE